MLRDQFGLKSGIDIPRPRLRCCLHAFAAMSMIDQLKAAAKEREAARRSKTKTIGRVCDDFYYVTDADVRDAASSATSYCAAAAGSSNSASAAAAPIKSFGSVAQDAWRPFHHSQESHRLLATLRYLNMLDHANSYEDWFGSVCDPHYFGCRVHDGLYRLLVSYRRRHNFMTLLYAAYQ